MRKLLMIFALVVGLSSCGSREQSAEVKTQEKDRVEVVYFHGKRRCATCQAIEQNARELVETMFAKELKSGEVVFTTVDITTPEGEKIADNYEVTWSSLFVNKWKDGTETRNDLTDFGFAYAASDSAKFKTELAQLIRESL